MAAAISLSWRIYSTHLPSLVAALRSPVRRPVHPKCAAQYSISLALVSTIAGEVIRLWGAYLLLIEVTFSVFTTPPEEGESQSAVGYLLNLSSWQGPKNMVLVQEDCNTLKIRRKAFEEPTGESELQHRKERGRRKRRIETKGYPPFYCHDLADKTPSTLLLYRRKSFQVIALSYIQPVNHRIPMGQRVQS